MATWPHPTLATKHRPSLRPATAAKGTGMGRLSARPSAAARETGMVTFHLSLYDWVDLSEGGGG
jgi:hypothetical protein